MFLNTRITQMLGIQYPIIQGGMHHIAYPKLASAVSNTGCLGTLNSTLYQTPEQFHEALREMKSLTDKPFCVNMSFLPDLSVSDQVERFIDLCGQEGVTAIETAGTKPDKLVSLIHNAGIIHIHKAPSTRHALSAQSCGVDAVSVIGLECGGHPGMNEIGTIVLANEAAHTLKIPVIAGGGIVDGAGIVAMLALGADAVLMGTRFLASEEAPISYNHKKWILESTERSTLLIQKSIHNMMRAADNEAARKCLELEAQKASLPQLMEVISGAKGKLAYESGNVDAGIFPVGVGCSLIHDIKPVKDIVQDLLEEIRISAGRFTSPSPNPLI